MRRPSPPSCRSLRAFLRALLRDRRGATAIEYGLILALVVLAMMASFTGVATTTTNMWNNVSTKVLAAH